jgi:hypothetical protein
MHIGEVICINEPNAILSAQAASNNTSEGNKIDKLNYTCSFHHTLL